MKGTVTLGNIYVASLKQSGSRLFWALAALTNYKVYRVDTTNAFAEAPPPVAPLFVEIDDSYRKWYENYRKLGKINYGNVLPI